MNLAEKRVWLLPSLTMAVLLILGIGAFFLYFQDVFVARRLARTNPELALSLLDLPDNRISKAPGTRLSYLGYSFEAPWRDLDSANVKVRGNTAIIPFHSGIFIVLMTNSSREILDTLEKPNREIMNRQFCSVYGLEACESDYGFMKTVFTTTPNEISWRTPRRKGQAELYLLLLRMGLSLDKSGTFSVQTQGFKGFQFGDLAKNNGKKLIDDLYSGEGKVQFIFGSRAGRLSQPEINRVLQTLTAL